MTIDVEKVAHLARLRIEDNDKIIYETELTKILELVETMNKADVSNIEPMAHPLELNQRQRPDLVSEQVKDNGQYEKLQKLTPHTEAGLYLVPQVIE
jgi:aspartyl-tRNA(Asn)/glutamyl-tRNA(Gln) amidotransferase subunit C